MTQPSTAVQASGRLRAAFLAPDVAGSVHWLPDAVLTWQGGRIVSLEPAARGEALPHENLLVLPGFVDLHCHWPQSHVRGAFSGQLLPWLRDSIWPAEAAFADDAVASQRAHTFFAEAIAAGTCAGLLFGPPFFSASRICAAVAPRGFFEGPALMEVNAPAELACPSEQILHDIEGLPTEQRRTVVVSPRFAPCMSEAGLAAAGQFAARLGLAVQSHLSENQDEVAWVHALFPSAQDYTDVYDRAGLLSPRTVMAHGIHLSDRELTRLAQSGTILAHCPTSNEALGSGRMDLARVRAHGVRWVLATDVGAGPLLSQLDVMRACLEVHARAPVAPVTAAETLCRATAIPGAFLADLQPELAGLGTLDVGAPAHLVLFQQPLPALDAESALRGLLAQPRAALETLPLAVYLWGALQHSPARHTTPTY